MTSVQSSSNLTDSGQPDASLVVAALGGDRAALGQIYDRYSNDIYSFAMSRLRNPDQAADATQETFVMVATRLSTLRHPERLRAWVFAIARNKIVDQVRYAQRSHTDVTESMAIYHGDHSASLSTNLESVESASLLWDAAGSLTERDRDLLELSIRHGLDGEDLADALGVAISHLHVLKSRMNDRLKKAVGSLLIARMGTEDCPDLATILRDWDGMFTLDVRSRVTRHVSDCDVCDNKQAALIGRGMAFGMLPIIPAPPSLRGSTIDAMADAIGAGPGPASTHIDDLGGWRGDGFPIASDQIAKPVAAGAATGAATKSTGVVALLGLIGIMLLAGIAFVGYQVFNSGEENAGFLLSDEGGAISTNPPVANPTTNTTGEAATTDTTAAATTDQPTTTEASTTPTTATTESTTSSTESTTTTTEPAPGRIVVETPLVDFGLNRTANLVLVNTGGTPVPYTVAVTSPFGAPEPKGEVGPGETKSIPLTIDRANLQSGTVAGEATITTPTDGHSTNHAAKLSAVVDAPPSIDRMAVSRAIVCGGFFSVTVAAFDDNGITAMDVTWGGPGVSGGGTLGGSGPTYSGEFGPIIATEDGTIAVTVTATDTAGQTTQRTESLSITRCR